MGDTGDQARGGRRSPRRELSLTQVANGLFATSLGMAAVSVPLLAVQSGHGLAAIGPLIALSAVTQTLARVGMGAAMDRLPTKFFIVTATILLAASCLLLGVTTAIWAFVVSQLLQGVARAYFWTGSQTHGVRASASAVHALAQLSIVTGIGSLAGPALAGAVGAFSIELSLLVAGAIAALATIPALLLTRFAPFQVPARSAASRRPRAMWRRSAVFDAGWMSGVAGAWRAMLNSYLPVLLTDAGHSVPLVGVLIALANLAAIAGAMVAVPVRRLGIRATLTVSILPTGIGVAVAALVPQNLILVVVALTVSGIGGGVLQTIAPALAADSVSAAERGRAIASTGTFRAVALLITPLGVAGLIGVLPFTAACAAAGALMAFPAALALRRNTAPPE